MTLATAASGTIDLGAAQLYHEVRGSGPPLLLISGGTGDAGDWDEVVTQGLAETFTVVTYDRRGFSRSRGQAGMNSVSLADHADDAATLLRALGLAPAAVVGHSSGGMVLCSLVERYPEVVQQALIYEPPLLTHVPGGEAMARGLAGFLEQALTQHGSSGAMELFIRQNAGDEAFEQWVGSITPAERDRVLGNGEVLLRVELPAVANFDPDTERMRSSGVPLTVVLGADNRDTWFGAAARWLADNTGAQLVEVPGGHGGFTTHPDAFVDLVRRTCGTAPAAPKSATEQAENYEREIVPVFQSWAERLVELAAPAAGERILEVACGTGMATRMLASRVGAGGQVIGIDNDAAMLDVARTATHPRLRPSIDWRLGDAHALPFADAEFDVVVCNEGLQFFADARGALSEMRRVLKPNGRLALAVWRPIRHQHGLEFLIAALEQHLTPMAAHLRGVAGPWERSDLRELVSSAGVHDVRVRIQGGSLRWPSMETCVRSTLGGAGLTAAVDALNGLSPEDRVALFQKLEALAGDDYLDDDGLVSPFEAYLITANG